MGSTLAGHDARLIECWGSEAEPAVSFKCSAKAIGLFIRKPAVFLRPFGKELLHLAHTLGSLGVEWLFLVLCKRVDTHGLALVESEWGVENDDAVLHVSNVRCWRR